MILNDWQICDLRFRKLWCIFFGSYCIYIYQKFVGKEEVQRRENKFIFGFLYKKFYYFSLFSYLANSNVNS